MEELSEGVSYGADPYRDCVTLMPRRELQSLALPSEIMRLANLSGYLKLPGPLPVARITLRYVKREAVAPAFVPAPYEGVRRVGPPGGTETGGGSGGPGGEPSGGRDGEAGGKDAALRQSQPALPFEPDTPDAQPGGADEAVDGSEPPDNDEPEAPPKPGDEGQGFY